MKEFVTEKDIKTFSEDFGSEAMNVVARNAVYKHGINESACDPDALVKYPCTFSIDINSGKITNQKHSGRCWMFASLNVMRLNVMKKLKLENMELSQAYPFFYDKLEKSNHFLENILSTLDEPSEGRVVSFLLQSPVGDGGQWDMFRSLIDKYGIVPKDVYPDSYSCENSSEMNKYITLKLREYAATLRSLHEHGTSLEELRNVKGDMLAEIYRILCICLGEPPKCFTWETRDKDNRFIRIEDITPQEFFKKYVDMDLDEMVTVINAPTKDKPYEKTYTVEYLASVRDGKYPVKYLNLPSEELKKLAIAQLKKGDVVWFGSDVGQFSTKDTGLLCNDARNVSAILGVDFAMTKAQRLDFGESCMTHAMVITGVNLDKDGKPNRWKVQNSWGTDSGVNGFYIMSDEWFDEFVYQILLDKKYFSDKQKKLFAQEPIVLKPWDPMGSLAE